MFMFSHDKLTMVTLIINCTLAVCPLPTKRQVGPAYAKDCYSGRLTIVRKQNSHVLFHIFNEQTNASENGKLDFNEFATLMALHMKTRAEMEDELTESFKVFDVDNDGFISSTELRQMLLAMGERLKPEEIDAIVKEWDSDGDGRIAYNGE